MDAERVGWLVFAGDWDDERGVTTAFGFYNDARVALARDLALYLTDTCRDCQAAAALALRRLLLSDGEAEFAGQVDGIDYLLIRPDRTEIDDLMQSDGDEPCPRCTHPLGYAHLFGPCFYVRCDCPDPHSVIR